MTFTVADVVQSLFTGKTLNQYIHNSSDLVAYSKDALVFFLSLNCEIGYRRNIADKKRYQIRDQQIENFCKEIRVDDFNYDEEKSKDELK